MIGKEIHDLAKQLWPLNRSLTGDGVRETLAIIKEQIPNLEILEVASGTKAFDWEVPFEWRVKSAYVIDPHGKKILDFAKNNLHLVGYSIGFHGKMRLKELQERLHSLKNQPSAIPYITSYYEDNWGFCLSENERRSLPEGEYEIVIDAEKFQGTLTYAELMIKGESTDEIFLSTYICHPSMANNELSGPCVLTFLAKWLMTLSNRRFSYRLIFIPETIGSIVYLSKNLEQMKANVFAGFNLTCIGDDRLYSILPSRDGNTISDQIGKHVLQHTDPNYVTYDWSVRGSDERQYCAPGIDLPIASIMRTKYGEYPEYHTSLDDLVNVVTPEGLEGGYRVMRRALEALESNCFPRVLVLGEPQLGKRGLYPNLSSKYPNPPLRLILNLLTWSDGRHSLLEIAEKLNVPIWELYSIAQNLESHELISLE